MIINWTSSKFICGFVLILMVSLGILVYFSTSEDLKNDIDPADNLATEETIG